MTLTLSRRQHFWNLLVFFLQLTLIGLLGTGPAWAAEVPFDPAQTIDGNFGGAISLQAADLDGDGFEELVGAASTDGDISIWENTAGDGGTWTETLVEGNFPGAKSVRLGNLDNRLGSSVDILAVSTDTIRAWRNTSNDGSVWTPTDISTAATFPGPTFAVPAEIDGIGGTDVVGVSTVGVSWWFNNFAIGQIWVKNDIEVTGGAASSVAVADIDGDGDTDVLVTFYDDDEVVWYENTAGNGTAWTRRTVATQFEGAQAVIAEDIDGDGDLDIAAAAVIDDTVAWWENLLGDGSMWNERVVDASVEDASSVEARDVDGDGDMDLLSAAAALGEMQWFDNTAGDGSAWTTRDLPGTFFGAAAAIALDVDDDGDQDVVGAALGAGDIAWWENQSIHRSAAYPVKEPVETALGSVRSVHTADVDGDGDDDLLAAIQDVGEVLWWENTGNGSAWTEHAIDTNYAGASGVYAGDIDGDGDLDVYATSDTQHNGVWWENLTGDGTSWGAPFLIFSGAFGGPSIPQIVDIDNDGTLDVMAVFPQLFRVVFWRNLNGLGTSWFQSIAQGNYPEARSAHAADIDGDGDADIATAASRDGQVSFVRNGLSQGFQTTFIDNNFPDAFSTFAADLDNDGDRDILAASRSTGEIAWWENTTGNGDFAARQTLATGFTGVTLIRAADLDGDGDEDVYGTSSSRNEMAWWENSGDGTSWTQHTVDTSLPQAGPVWNADLNRDGQMDLLAGGNGELHWWPNRGGEFALPTTDVAMAVVGDGSAVPVLRIEGTHNGRTGDSPVELATVEILLESTVGMPMTDAEADALLVELSLYADDGSGSFEQADDTEIATLQTFALDQGVATLTVADDQTAAQIAAGGTRSFFVVPTFEATASSTLLDGFRFTHITEASSTGEDAAADLPLTLEYSANVSTMPIGFNAAPTAQNDDLALNEDQSLSSNVLDGTAGGLDTDPNGDSLTAVLVSPPTHGVLVGGLAANGDFQYMPNGDFAGLDAFTYRADDGFTTSDIATVTLMVAQVNDPPSFNVTTQHVSSEDASAQTVPGFASAITPGPANEAGQTVAFSVSTNSNPGLFSAAPALAANGTLTYRAAANATGTATITVRLNDDGGTANGGIDQSVEQSFDIVIQGINDPPSFTLPAGQTTSSEDAGAQSVLGFATQITAGPSDEAGQDVSFAVVGNTNPSLFSAPPALTPDGTLTYTASADRNGAATLTVRLTDDGGTSGGGTDQSPEQSFDIVVNAVNDAPSFSLPNPQTTSSEDGGAQSVPGFAGDILAGPDDEVGQVVSFTVISNSAPELFATPPALAPDGTLTYTAANDGAGTATITVRLSDDGGTTNGGTDQSDEQSFDIVVQDVNDAPSFSLPTQQTTSSEDGGAQSIPGFATDIVAGPEGEAGQTVSFEVTGNTDPGLFAAPPALASDGTLTYTAAEDGNGTATLTVRLTDDGGTANGGTDQSDEQSFDIVVDAVNDAPSFAVTAQHQAVEDGGPQTVSAFAISISPGPSDEASQAVSFLITNNTNPSLFASLPALSSDGTLTYTPAPNSLGTATVTVRLMDDGGTANGGTDQSAEQTFDVVIEGVNDPPSFTITSLASSLEDAGAQTVTGFATSISPGPADESGQTVSFLVTGNSNPGLFAASPALSSDGTLTYTSAGDGNGTATLTVVLMDDGGTAGGGVDQSAPQSFDIQVGAVNDAPSFGVPEELLAEANDAPQMVTAFATEISAGPADEGGQALQFQIVDYSNPGLFTAGPELASDGTLTFTLVAGASDVSAILEAVLMDDGGTDFGGSDASPSMVFEIVVPDAVAPQVISVTTAAGVLEACTEARQTFGQLAVSFSESMAFDGDPDEPSNVLNPENYQVIGSGPDRDVTTSTCGSLDGDDLRVATASVMATIEETEGVLVELSNSLDDGLYKLLICDTLEDASGNALSETFEVAFRVSTENLFANGQVDCDLNTWQVATSLGESGDEIEYSEQDVDDSALSGSIGVFSFANPNFALGQCIDVASSSYDLAARVRVEGLSGVEVQVDLHCERFDQPGCSGNFLGDSSSQVVLSPTGGAWQLLEHTSTGGQSALCGVDLSLVAGDGFEAFVDGLFVSTQLFADGFESGTTDAWSQAVP